MLSFFALTLISTCLIGLTFSAKPQTSGATGDIPQVAALCALINSTNIGASYPDTWDCSRLRANPSFICDNTLPGVYCSVDGVLNITYINLDSQGLQGSLPSELGLLTTLAMFSSWQNLLTGTIPSALGSLPLLSYLDLGQNQLTGSIPTQLFGRTQLQKIDFDQNALTGSIPTQIGLLGPMLTSFDVSSNQLTGPLPTEMGRLYNLQTLNVQANAIVGTVPNSLANLVSIQYFMLYNNKLSGTIPSWIGKLGYSLQVLALGWNHFSGSVPSSFGGLSYVQALYLPNTYVSGSIPSQLGQMTTLTYLDMSRSLLRGSLPSQLSALSNLVVLDLSQNALSGNIPAVIGSNMYDLNYLDLSQNTALVGACWPWPYISLNHCDVLGISFLCQCDCTQICQQAACHNSSKIQAQQQLSSHSARRVDVQARFREDALVDRKAIGAIPIKSRDWKSTKFVPKNIGTSRQ